MKGRAFLSRFGYQSRLWWKTGDSISKNYGEVFDSAKELAGNRKFTFPVLPVSGGVGPVEHACAIVGTAYPETMSSPKETAALLGKELKSAPKAEQFRFWAKRALADNLKNDLSIIPQGLDAADFVETLTLHEVTFDEAQVDKADPIVILSYLTTDGKFVVANLIVRNVEKDWSANMLKFWDYGLGSPHFRVVGIRRLD